MKPECGCIESCGVNDSCCLQILCFTDVHPNPRTMVSALWFRWVTLNPAPGKRRKAVFGDFSHSGLCQDLVTAGLVTCGLVEMLYLLGRVPPWCFGVKEGWKMPRLAKNGPFLCELHFFPQPGETETHGFYNISRPNDDAHLAKAVISRVWVAVCLLLHEQRLVQTKPIIHMHWNSDCSSEVTLKALE